METKKQIRKRILSLRDDLCKETQLEQSHAIMDFVTASQEFMLADQVLLFASFGSEVDTDGIFAYGAMLGKEIYFPKIEGDVMNFYQVAQKEDLKPGFRDILEPDEEQILSGASKKFVFDDKNQILLIMPGVCFDLEGSRIGYGRGFYDRFLEEISASGLDETAMVKMAVCFSCQVVETGIIPKEAHDIAPDFVVTGEQVYRIRKQNF